MATELIRFELYHEGNVHDGGLVSSHDDTGLMNYDDETCIKAIREFNRALDVPPYYMLGEDNRAFFTPEGYARFEKVIARLIDSIHRYCHGWEVREVRAIVPQEYVVFEDHYQKLVDLYYYQEKIANMEAIQNG